MRKTIAATAAVAALAALGLTGCDALENAATATSAPATTAVQPVESVLPVDAETDDDAGMTTAQSNAVDKAEQYLAYSAFSRTGLIKQLEFEGFSNADATFAVDHLDVDWNEQAVKKAKEYMDYTSFSRSGLTDQLVFEGFTQAQAEHGAASQF